MRCGGCLSCRELLLYWYLFILLMFVFILVVFESSFVERMPLLLFCGFFSRLRKSVPTDINAFIVLKHFRRCKKKFIRGCKVSICGMWFRVAFELRIFTGWGSAAWVYEYEYFFLFIYWVDIKEQFLSSNCLFSSVYASWSSQDSQMKLYL